MKTAMTLLAGLVIVVFTGCTSLSDETVREYQVDCNDCKLHIEYDISKKNKELEIGGY